MSEWKGKIEYENGVKVIVNPEEPMFGEINLELKKDLSIGGRHDENFQFYGVRGIDVDGKGNIYVVDSGNHRVQKFDKTGNHLASIGRRGQGPGEFNNPLNIRCHAETGYIFVNEPSGRISAFKQDGRYLDQDILPGEALTDFYIDADQNVIGNVSASRYRSLVSIEKGERGGRKIVEFPFQVNIQVRSRSEKGAGTFSQAFGGTHGYEFDLFLSQIDSKTFIYGFSRDYELPVINGQGENLFIIRKNALTKNFSKKIRDRIIYGVKMSALRRGKSVSDDYAYSFPEHMPFFYSIMADSEGLIYVQTGTEELDPSRARTYDIFTRDGYYMYRVFLEIPPLIIKRDYVNTLARDADSGVEIVQRYKIINGGQLKR